MSQSQQQTKQSRTLIEKILLGCLLVAILGIPVCVTTLVDDGEDKWFLIRTIGPLLGVLLLIHQSGKPVTIRPFDALAFFSLAWIAAQAISMIGTVNMGASLTGLTRQIGLVSFFFLVRFFAKDHGSILKIAGVLLILGFATSVYGIVQHFGRDFIQWQVHREVPIERGVSFMGHATFAASVIVMLIPVAIAVAIHIRSKIVRMVLAVVTLVMLYHLSFTGARVATVALFLAVTVGIFIQIIVLKRKSLSESGGSGSTQIRLGGLVLVVVAIVGAVFIGRAWSLKNSDVLGLLEGGLAQRIYAWETANRMFLTHPVNGVGIGNYEVASPKFWNVVEQNRFAQFQRSLHQPHNEYFEAASETGLPGIAALLGIVVFGLSQCIVRSKLSPALSAGLFISILASALDAFFLFPWQLPASGLIFWVLLGMVSGQSELQPTSQDIIQEPEIVLS
jgi:O-antigen ligase